MNSIKLIEAVKKQSSIYKNLHEDDEEYGREWQKVAKLVNCEVTAEQAQDQWNEILLEYMEYLRGNQDFALAKHMDFLQPYLFTMVDHVLDEDELSNILAEDERIRMDDAEHAENRSGKEAEKNQTEETTKDIASTNKAKVQENETIKEEPMPPMPAPIEKITIPCAPPSHQENKVQQHDSSFSSLSSMELIFLGYAKQLQKMPLTLQLKTKRKIADIMDEAELKMMEGLL